MKGIYITEEGKKEIEAKIAELEAKKEETGYQYISNPYGNGLLVGHIRIYKEILESATILPVEESWERLEENLLEGLHEHTKIENVIAIDYPNGVVIQPKK